MFVELPWLFLGLLVGLVISAIAAPPTRKEPRVPEPHDTTV
jgi:hypothetical protein